MSRQAHSHAARRKAVCAICEKAFIDFHNLAAGKDRFCAPCATAAALMVLRSKRNKHNQQDNQQQNKEEMK